MNISKASREFLIHGSDFNTLKENEYVKMKDRNDETLQRKKGLQTCGKCMEGVKLVAAFTLCQERKLKNHENTG